MTVRSPYATQLEQVPVERLEVPVLGSLTRYWVYGPKDATTTILVVHGYRGEHHGLEPVIAQLPGIRFISPDLPAFGQSTPLTEVDHDVAGYSKWLTAFAAIVDPGHTSILLGHSFGTIVAARAVADEGYSTPVLLLVNPIAASALKGSFALGTKVTVALYRFAGRLPERVGTRLLKNWGVVQIMSSTLVKSKDRYLRRWIHEEHHRYFSRFATRETVIEGFEASIANDVSQYADRITVPTLLVAAELDAIAPLAGNHELVKTMTDATLAVMPGVGHLVHYETPGLAATAITTYLSAHDLL
jgi:pimeloyl-ACP methyl ester carboxylesterase